MKPNHQPNHQPNLCQTYLESQVIIKKDKSDPLSSLTNREEELFKLVVTGNTNKDIAKKLSISEHTVRNHIASIFAKLKVNNRTEAAFLYHSKQSEKGSLLDMVTRPKDDDDWIPRHPLELKYSKGEYSKVGSKGGGK